MKKILFLIQSPDMPSSRVRVLNLLTKLEKKGYHITCIRYPKKLNDKILLFRSLINFDIVFLQKKLPSPIDSYILGRLSKKLIYDFDDAVYMKHESYGKKQSFAAIMKFKSIVKYSSAVIAGNRILAEEALRFNKNVHIIPSVVETDNLPVRDYGVQNDKFTVGWVGGNINLSQLALLNGVFRKLSGEIPLEVRVISGKEPDMPGVDMKFIPWTVDGQDAEIAKFDAGVMPLPDSPYARGKCAYKALQYMAAGVVPVVSNVGVNADVAEKGKCGLVADNIDDFYTELKYLSKNRGQMREMGENAAKRVREKFSVDYAVDRLDEIFASL